MENNKQENFTEFGVDHITYGLSSAFTVPSKGLTIQVGAKFQGYIESDENGIRIGPCPHCGFMFDAEKV